MKNQQSELTKLLLAKLEEMTTAHEKQLLKLVNEHEMQLTQQQEFFVQQQRQWEQKVADLSAQVQALQEQLTNFSKSLKPLTKQLDSLATLSATLRDS